MKRIFSYISILTLILLVSTCAKVNVFREPPDSPVIDSIAPASGVVGTQIRLYGSGFSFYPSENILSINGVRVRVDSPASSNIMLATIIDSTGTGPVHIKVHDKESDGPIFTFNQTDPNGPVITNINPTSGWDYTTTSVVIKGLRFGTNPDSLVVKFDNLIASVQQISDTQLVVAPPTHAPGYATVTVIVKEKISNGVQYQYVNPNVPVITRINPTSGWDYTTTSVVISGSHFGTDQNSIVVKFDTSTASVQLVKDTQLVVAPPTHTAGPVTVTVIVKGAVSNGVQYTYINPNNPLITRISPTSGWDYTTTSVIISGSHFGTDQNSITVKFDNLAASVQSVKDTQLIVAPPTHAAGAVTVTVTVNGNASNGVQYTYVTPGGIEYSGTVQLSEARELLAAAGAGNKIVIAGGVGVSSVFSKTVDIYDVSSNTWATAQLSQGRENLVAAAAGNKVVFAGGDAGGYSSLFFAPLDAVDIYDVSTNTWSTAQLSQPRSNLAAAAAGNKIVFAGGVFRTFNGYSNVVDIYDVSTNTWSTAQLSEARAQLVAAAAGNKIVFAGGANSDFSLSKTVDIYDVSTNTWSTAQLTETKNQLAAAAAGNKIVFAGGGNGTYSTTADIYDVSTNTWSTAPFNEGRGDLAAAGAGSKIAFGGGYGSAGSSQTVDIYDVLTNTWTTLQLSEARYFLAGAAAGNKIIFAGGYNAAVSKTVDIFTVH